ncbi:SGNH/GDSL hydrolase family protein [Actinomadura craniellae]|uniref:SGNH/GDSL hydrolase family protein n=1 Tax=Actinomadura craniellae TaxID=2231787 RepID=A0A365GWZ4_9ACTN|nr:SGNH/GDSL hydrolase family protein [Actinomadura craniellae]RAY11349.1 SGNH/GDSL hydrolase family protein [Actinomadura craniellae]
MRRLISFTLTAFLVLCGCAASASPVPRADRAVTAPPVAAPRTPPAPPEPPVVFVLGDSYTAGLSDVPPEQTYAADTARTLGWQVVIAGWRGTGYLARGQIDKNFAAMFRDQLAWRPAPDMIVISGGHNDWTKDPALVSAAARRLLAAVKAHWPRTHVVLLGPLWGGDPPLRAHALHDGLREVATSLGVPFIDPLRERWITGSVRLGTGNAARYTLPDGIHPTRAGNRYLARRLGADLRALGLDRPRRGVPPVAPPVNAAAP